MDHCLHVGGWCTESECDSLGWRSSYWGGPHILVGEHLKDDKVTSFLTRMHWMTQFISAFRAWDKIKRISICECHTDHESSVSYHKTKLWPWFQFQGMLHIKYKFLFVFCLLLRDLPCTCHSVSVGRTLGFLFLLLTATVLTAPINRI